MRILILHDGRRGPADRTRIQFLLGLKNYCDINVYGPKEDRHIKDHKILPLDYKNEITANDLIHELKPDVFLFILSSHNYKN
jgi:hypothetical protein